MLCENSTDKSQGLEIKLLCNIDNQICSFYRYCVTDKCIKMRQTYENCPKRSDQMGRPRKIPVEESNHIASSSPTENLEIKIETPKSQKSKQKKQICNVLYKTDKKFAIEFDGCGISIRDSVSNKTNQVEVLYQGDFGTKNFEIISHKFI